jgi:hypothetical protein
MREILLPCPECYYEILSVDSAAALTWYDLAEDINPEKPFVYIEVGCKCGCSRHLEEDLMYLEALGYIVSIDFGEDRWVIKFNGIRPGKSLICIGDHLDEV